MAGTFKTFFSGPSHDTAIKWLGFGPESGWKGKAFGATFLAYSAYAGYQESGVFGAVKSVGTDYLLTRGVAAVGGFIGAPIVGATAVGAGIGAYAFRRQLSRPWVKEHMRKHDRLEMGTPAIDNYGNVSTMRQRSLQAINNSKLNGRTALGNEGALTYQNYWR